MLTFKGEYDSTKTYTRLDAVTYQGSSYVCLADTSSTPPSDSWQVLAQKGTDGKDGKDGQPGHDGKDGKTPYLHTAYSWSTDGTDRFMTVYPEENYIENSQPNNDSGWFFSSGGTDNHKVVDGQYIEITRTGGSYHQINRQYQNDKDGWYSEIKPGDQFTISMDISMTTVPTLESNIYGQLRLNAGDTFNSTQKLWNLKDIIKEANKWYRVSSVTDIPAHWETDFTKATQARFIIESISGSDTDVIRIRNIKLETGNMPTPYTTSPLDDPEGAYPKFVGTYTDYIADDSTDPSKYTWAKLRGEQGPKGEKGDTGPRGPQGLPGKDGVSPDTSTFALKSELPDLSNYATKNQIPTDTVTHSELSQLSDKVTQANQVKTITSGLLTDLAESNGVYHYEIDFFPDDRPTLTYGLLDVVVGTHYAKQTFTDDVGDIYVRMRGYDGTWSSWRQITQWS